MQNITPKFEEIYRQEHYTRAKVSIGGQNYGYNRVHSIHIQGRVFADGAISVGGAISRTLEMEFIPIGEIPPMAEIKVSVALESMNGEKTEYIPAGTFYIDTRKRNKISGTMTIKAYDAMEFTEKMFPYDDFVFPKSDITVLKKCAKFCGITIEQETIDIINKGYSIPANIDLSCREIMGYIAGLYGGNFVISDAGKLRFLGIRIPDETFYLVTEHGDYITIGGERINVG